MFGSNNKKDNSSSDTLTTSSTAINTLVEGTKVEGTIKAQNDIRIDGALEGSLKTSGKLIIGPNGSLKGDAHCENAVIEGLFDGDLNVNGVLDIRETATVNGEIKTGKLLVQNGAKFNGNCDMGSHIVKEVPKKAAALN